MRPEGSQYAKDGHRPSDISNKLVQALKGRNPRKSIPSAEILFSA
jgi:hypothetical protein